MHDVILVKKGEAFNDRCKSIADFFFIKVEDIVSSFSIFDLRLKSGLLLSV